MMGTYTSGVWIVKPGEQDEFVAAWKELVATGAAMPGSGDFRLLRDAHQGDRFMSFAVWESFEAQEAWRQSPEFAERLKVARSHCADFHTYTYELVAEAVVAEVS
jgi:heme-degrading monooxygenase HmoA